MNLFESVGVEGFKSARERDEDLEASRETYNVEETGRGAIRIVRSENKKGLTFQNGGT